MISKIALGAAAALAIVGQAQAAVSTPVLATDNATVQPGGPRSGDSGKNFFNVQGFSNSQFASFGVADFAVSPTDLGYSDDVASINGITIEFTQQNAFFTTDGEVSIYAWSDTGADIQPGALLAFNGTGTPVGLDTILSPTGTFVKIAEGDFVEGADGDVDAYSAASISTEVNDFVVDAINNGGVLRVVVLPEDGDVSATWAGFGNTDSAGPTLTIDANLVPEPSMLGLLGLAGLSLARRRR